MGAYHGENSNSINIDKIDCFFQQLKELKLYIYATILLAL